MINSSNVNKVILLGRITDMPRWHEQDGKRLLCFPLLTVEHIKKNSITEPHFETHQVCLAERMIDDVNSLLKDTTVYVQGKLKTSLYIDEQMIKRYHTAVMAYSIEVYSTEVSYNPVL